MHTTYRANRTGWAAAKAAAARRQIDALNREPVAGDWKQRARRARAVSSLLATEARYRGIVARAEPYPDDLPF